MIMCIDVFEHVQKSITYEKLNEPFVSMIIINKSFDDVVYDMYQKIEECGIYQKQMKDVKNKEL